MLEIIVGARKPLSLQQLRECFAITASDQTYSELQLQPDVARSVGQLCKNFVRIIDDHCYLMHQSAKELQAPKPPPNSTGSTRMLHMLPRLWLRCTWFLNLHEYSAHAMITATVMQGDRSNPGYIIWPSHIVYALRKRHKRYGFFRYALHYWDDHF